MAIGGLFLPRNFFDTKYLYNKKSFLGEIKMDNLQNAIPQKAHPHMEFLRLDQNSSNYDECIVLRTDGYGNKMFIKVANLDKTDANRLLAILQSPAARLPGVELWRVLLEKRLGNGMNALEYFHQLVKVFNVHSGEVRDFNIAQIMANINTLTRVSAEQLPVQSPEVVPTTESTETPKTTKKK